MKSVIRGSSSFIVLIIMIMTILHAQVILSDDQYLNDCPWRNRKLQNVGGITVKRIRICRSLPRHSPGGAVPAPCIPPRL
ncbi:hypothetical protein CDL15_Pgr026352 [Punica granatum]|uniref:Uncharacterized protein n=1 Tax=Punica granatum TaxID=22663 RepID=A0A218XNS9_PUNGR|nr:hypothetical protein CDL15_Pgr026352 [Punica granatum]PKI51903.1 hypothetical protein CRG98_027736 [Punica granatum]